MDYYSSQVAQRRSRRRAFSLGKRAALAPRDRKAAVQLARHALSHLSDVDAHALIVEQALTEEDDVKIVRAASVLIGALTVLVCRLSLLRKALFVEQIFKAGREIMSTYVARDDVVEERTLH
jgi:hypothetical protein